MKRKFYVFAGLVILLFVAFQVKPWHYLFEISRKPLSGEIIYRDQRHVVVGNSGSVTVRNQRTGAKVRLGVNAGEIRSVDRILNNSEQELPLFGVAIADGLKLVTAQEIHLVRTEPTVRLLATYPPPRGNEDRIIISKGRNRLYFYRSGELAASYPVATGKRPEYTPEGTFTIANKIPDPGRSDPDSRLGVRWMGLAVPCEKDPRRKADSRAPCGNKYGIHGTDEPDSIGTHASGGCIRLRNEDIVVLYDLVSIGTTVEITE